MLGREEEEGEEVRFGESGRMESLCGFRGVSEDCWRTSEGFEVVTVIEMLAREGASLLGLPVVCL